MDVDILVVGAREIRKAPGVERVQRDDVRAFGDFQIAQIFDLKRRAVEALLSVRPRYQEQGLLRIGIAEDGDVDREFLVLGAACRRVHSRYDRRTARRGQRQEFLAGRSEEHTSELQSLMRISYAVFCLKQKTLKNTQTT